MPEEPKRKRFEMIRDFALADFITLANAACGTVAILLCASYMEERDTALMWTAMALFPIAVAADALEGAVAPGRRPPSARGADLDSLADIISFGVAPAVLAYTLGMRGGWDGAVLVYFVACGISRLARYNVTAEDLAGESGKVKYYEGTPIPTSLLLVAVLAVAFGMGDVHASLWGGEYRIGPWLFHPLSLIYAVSGSLMISTFRIPKP